MVGTGRFELPTPRTPSECSTRLSHVPTRKESVHWRRMGLTPQFYTTSHRYVRQPGKLLRLAATHGVVTNGNSIKLVWSGAW
jgi:hypothetical protein